MSTNKIKIISGLPFSGTTTDLQAHLMLFRYAPRFGKDIKTWRSGDTESPISDYVGEGRFEHAKRIGQYLFPKAFEWHRWSESVVRQACQHSWFACTGCGTSGKSTSIGFYALLYWFCDPLNTAVLNISKTVDSAKRRIWSEVARFFYALRTAGYKEASIRFSPRPAIMPNLEFGKDEKHGLYVAALHGKELEKEKEYIKGFHPRRILVVADELDSLEEGGQALIEVFVDNLSSGAEEAQFIGLGNDPSLLNALGDIMAPGKGQPVTLEHTEWVSQRNVHCLRLDAWDSPNVKGEGKFTGIIRQKDIDEKVAWFGANSPSIYIQLHGIHPPAGVFNTVLNESHLIKFHAFDAVTWMDRFTLSAALDPAFGGDKCIFRTFRNGRDTMRQMRVAVDEVIEIPVDASIKDVPVDDQIARQVIQLCKDRRIPATEFSILSWGIGRGVAANLKRWWSPNIVEVTEAGLPTERVLTQENPAPANEQYDRRVTELWFQARVFVEADMIRNLDKATAVQLCSRTYEDVGTGGRRKLSVQKKEEMLSSPDEADCFCCGLENLILKGLLPEIKVSQEVQKNARSFERRMEKFVAEADDSNLYPSDLEVAYEDF